MPEFPMLPFPLAAATQETFLITVLVQLTVIIAVARAFGILFRRIGQPAVVGEITAGVILGPSVFGKLELLAGLSNHPISQAIFNPAVSDVFKLLSDLGLILLLFLVGLEFDFSHLKTSHRAAISISVTGVVLPFVLGYGLAHWIQPYLEPVDLGQGKSAPVELHGFALFMGTAMAITALPVLGRMLMEFNVMRTRLAAITISAAAVDDATGWIILAAVSAVVHSDYNIVSTLTMVGLTVGFAALMAFVARPLLIRWINWTLARGHGELGHTAIAMLLIIIMLAAIATSLIGIFAIFGAFILGAVLSDQRAFQHAVSRQLRNFVTVFFLPIFFTYTGLKTDIGTLTRPELWAFAAAICAAAIAGKLGGCTLAARVSGLPWRESLCVGSLMNTRGLMELVVINVGYELHVIPRSVYCMLVIMALLTNYMTTPLVLALKKGTELEEPMSHSPLARRKRLTVLA
jgi:Kef-type K+ transport system membrane component KefB